MKRLFRVSSYTNSKGNSFPSLLPTGKHIQTHKPEREMEEEKGYETVKQRKEKAGDKSVCRKSKMKR